MNIHLRATGRLLKIMSIPAIVGILVVIIFEFFPLTHILIGVSFALLLFMFCLFYKWTLEQIKSEDAIKKMQEEYKAKKVV